MVEIVFLYVKNGKQFLQFFFLFFWGEFFRILNYLACYCVLQISVGVFGLGHCNSMAMFRFTWHWSLTLILFIELARAYEFYELIFKLWDLELVIFIYFSPYIRCCFVPMNTESLHFSFIFWNLCLFFCRFCIFEIRVTNLYENHGDTNNKDTIWNFWALFIFIYNLIIHFVNLIFEWCRNLTRLTENITRKESGLTLT